MKTSLLIGAATLALALTSTVTHAHRVWVKPSATTVSGDSEWITFDAAVANSIFSADHVALPADRLTVVSPSGQPVPIQNSQKLRYRSVFDVELTEPGTYKVFNASQTLTAFWQDANGERHFWPGRGKTGSVEEFYKAVPQDAKELMVTDSARRLEVYVTLGAPTARNNQLTGRGLELKALTHPNDAYTGEPLEFQFYMNGEVAPQTAVTLVKEGEKYRDTNKSKALTADANGLISLQIDEPGMYWLEAEYEDENVAPPAMKRTGTYVLIFEVLPL
ncbi:DUF4198 domain-containing protein [Alteromonas lipolytica]|uniref:ABC transporter permease n=1 Tax=Alteromonas lipolytica TaxID=1856405 RepID=A0A1E8FA27_9ALTE|nr:DUF4198 domain-containing protein [Alteromonas lipolytica]OFI32774.1 ABC transporter permease [Alteromonas lipolytica]GGF73153.1 ABC transporter permease [Alteromonas lipolytica]